MMAFLSRSIPRRILASLVAIYIATYLATALVVYSGVRSSILESNRNALHQLAELKYERLVNVMETLATNVTAWSQLEVMNDLVSGDIDKRVARTLDDLKQLYGLTGNLYAFDKTGNLIATTRVIHASDPTGHLPPEWKLAQESGLVLRGKHTDPFADRQIVAFEVPVYGSFDKTFRIGTLVLTYPWATVEKLLFSTETGTILVEAGEPIHVLAADPVGISSRVEFDPQKPPDNALIIGRSTPKTGILGTWQVDSLQETRVVTHSLRHVVAELAILGAALGIPILVLGRWLSNRLTAPVMELTRVVREIADTDKLDARVPVSSDDELGTLARSFNRMTESLERATIEREQFVRDLEMLNQTLEGKVVARTSELEAAIMAQQRLIGDISHEIKSPLARLGVALGLARLTSKNVAPKHFDRMEQEIDAVSALASELLTLARLDGASAAVEFAEVDLCELVAQIVADAVYEAPLRTNDVALLEPDDPIVVVGNEDLLRRAIENVVRNALFYTAPNTPVTIAIALNNSGRVSIEIGDQGPGVPETALAHLFEPFYRVDEARARKTGGSGVGLTICQRVVALHGGSVQARNNRPHGLIVEIEIPVSRQSA
jgi:signal transduction histidine kinase